MIPRGTHPHPATLPARRAAFHASTPGWAPFLLALHALALAVATFPLARRLSILADVSRTLAASLAGICAPEPEEAPQLFSSRKRIAAASCACRDQRCAASAWLIAF